MNNIYKRLSQEATLYCQQEGSRQGLTEGETFAWLWEKRYAELIVQECIKACEDWWHNSYGVSQGNIKQHFGMNE